MGIFSVITGIFKPATDLVDNLHTSDEEKLTLRNKLESIRANVSSKVLDLQSQLVTAQQNVLVAEATGNSWQRSWRPIMAIAFGSIVVVQFILGSLYTLGLIGIAPPPVPDKMWNLLTVMIGGYVVGRSAEKTVRLWKNGNNKGNNK